MITQITEDKQTIYARFDDIDYRYNKAGLLDFWCADPCKDWRFVEDNHKRNEIINKIMELVKDM